ncbi:transcriptional activator of morphogenic pathway [Buchnera aphidicola (Cinara tujafilina)]|uniref:Transcriptional activator of morphogenic pathway n=1 Tax=Buchnera aphidicola (Cinara tujafilina) TaxID=261317 RepID=F7WZL0_9GAMM|nr:BolA family protein [Buchnera aphidicola]AEH39877.1 transcriptional activator of morphogenic pathway [Buchnera aphidicola (Cinara tujafilina)]
MKELIYKKNKKKINIFYFKIYNDTKKHILKNTIKKHYRIIIVSKIFHNLSLIHRHKKIYSILYKYIPHKIYSLQIYAYSTKEWSILPKKIHRVIQCSKKLYKKDNQN